MIRIFYSVLIFFILNTMLLFSQVHIGAFAGGMNSFFNGDAPEDAEYTGKFGFSGGIIADFNLTEDLVLSIQPRYLQKGTTASYDIGEYELHDSLSTSLDYVSIPVIIKFNSLNGRVFFSSGLDFGYLISSSIKNLYDGSTKDAGDYLKKYDLSASFGIGLNFPIWGPIFSIECRYMQSLLNISDISPDESGLNFPYRFRTSGIQVLAGVLFPL